MVPTRADRRCYVLFSIQSRERAWEHWGQRAIAQQIGTKDAFTESREQSEMEAAFTTTLDPIAGSPATGKSVAGTMNLFVDDLFGTSGNEEEQRVLTTLRKDFQVGSEDWNDVTFTRQWIRWTQDSQNGPYIEISQNKATDELEEIPVERNTKEDLHCTPSMHTTNRTLLRQINWLQSTTQFQCCYNFSRCASMAGSPTIGDVKALNKLARQIKSQPVKLQYWPLEMPLTEITMMALHREAWQCWQNRVSDQRMECHMGVLVEYESQKIVLWFIPVAPWIMDESIWWGYKYPHENWCEEPGNDSKNDSFTWTERRPFTWSLCCERKPVQEVVMILLTVQPKMARQTASRILQPWRTIWSQLCRQENCLMLTFILILEPWKSQCLLVNLVQNIFAHKGEGSLLPEHTQDLSCTNSPRRTISGDVVCGDSAAKRAKETEYTHAWGSGYCENNVCTRRVMHPISLVSDADLDDNTDVRNIPNRTQSSSSQKRSMKQDLSGSTTSFPYWWECCVCVWLLWTFCIVLRPLLLAWWPWRY